MKRLLLSLALLLALCVPWTQVYADTGTVADGTGINSYVPFYGYYADDSNNHTQIIYKASDLAGISLDSGKLITQLQFYASSSHNYTATWRVKLGKSTDASFSSASFNTSASLTQVYQGTFSIVNNVLTIPFDNEYAYTGGNLLVDISIVSSGDYNSLSWYGQSVTGASLNQYGSNSVSSKNWLPKTTFSFETPATCAVIKNLETTTTRTSVTATWAQKTGVTNCLGYEVKLTSTNDPEATALQSATISDPTTLTYTFNNLERETTYYVHVRSNCGNDDGYSAWVSASATTLSLLDCDNPNNVVLVADGTETNEYVPVYGYYCDSQQKSQSIYPESMLTGLVGKTISKLKYYVYSGSSSSWSSSVFNIRVMETTATTLSDFASTTDATLVYTGTLSASVAGGMEINLTTPFTYNGGNLLIEFELATTSSYAHCYFYGISATSASYERYGSNSSTKNFLPKVDFGYCQELEACPAVTVTVPDSTITTTSAVINWTASTADYFGSYDLLVSDTVVADPTQLTPQYTGLTATTDTLTGLEQYHDYYVYVRVNCNGLGHDDGDAWSEGVHFQTLSPCNVPTNLNVELRSKRSAMLRWTTTAQPNNYRYFITTNQQEAPSTPTVSGIYGDSVLIENLTPGTTYYLYLSNMCGKADGCSPWVPVTFTTPAACLDPDTVYASDIDMYQITLNWEPNQYADPTDAYDVYIDTVQVTDFASVTPTATGVTGTSYTFDTLFRNTLYYMYVRVNCGEAGANNWKEVAQRTDSLAPDCQEKQLGTGTGSTYDVGTKWYTSYGYGQTLFNANEFGDNADVRKGTITSISFDVAQASSYSANWKIYLGHTPNSSLTSWVPYSSLTEVATKTGTFTAGWYTIELTTPFEYNGIDNLVLAIANQTGNYSGGSSLKFHYEYKSSPYMCYIRGNDYISSYGDPTYTTSGSTSGYRMNMKFNICNEAVACPVIDLVTIPAETVLNDQALITWTRGTGDFTSSYNIIVAPYQVTKPDTVFIQKPANVVIDSNIVDTFYLAQGLIADTTYYVYVRVNCKEQPYDDGSSNWKLVEPAFITEKSCVKPYDFQVTGATSTTMSLQWLNRKNASNWELGINDSIVNVTLSDDTCRYTVTGLTRNTEYTYTLRAICGEGDTSEMVTLPGGFYQRTLNDETNIRVDSIYYLELIPNTIAQDTANHTITATVRKGSDLTDVRFEYDRSDYVSKVTSSSGDIQGNFGTLDLTTPATLTVVAEDTVISQDWTMTLTEEACATPYNVKAKNVSRRTADLTWNVGDNSTSFDFVLSTTELTEPTTGIQTVTATNVDGYCTYALTGLSRETTYYAYVRTNCGTEYGQWRGTSFTTKGTGGCADSQVGTGSSSAYLVHTNWGNTYSQHIYTAWELTKLGYEAGEISSVQFYYSGSSSSYSKEQSVYIGTIADSTFSGTGASNFATGLTLAYGPDTHAYPGSGWYTYTFATPFVWDGVSNIVVGVLTNQPYGVNQSSSYGWNSHGTSVSGYRTIYGAKDNGQIDVNNLSFGTTSRTSTRPNIKFTICNIVDPCPEVADLEVTDIEATTATITWTATGDYPGTSDVFVSTTEVDTATITTPTATGITGTTYSLTSLIPYTDYYVYVRTHCNGEGQDDGISPWSMTTFKTESQCAYPRNVVATVTGKTTAHIEWTNAAGQVSTDTYEYAYSTDEVQPSAASGTSTTGSADLSGLTANTTYYIYVRKNCGSNQSPWIEANAITMPAAMPAPIIEETYDISFNAFKVRWTKDYENFANETQWQYACVASGESPSAWTTTTDTTALIYGLTESTPYDFRVRAYDGINTSADATEEVTTTAQTGDCNTVAELGEVTSSMPLVSQYGSEYSITIYTADELRARGFAAGTIEAIGYYQVSCGNTTTANTYQKTTTVWMGNVAKSSFTGPTDWISTNDLTPVKNEGIVDFNKVNDWVTITLDNAFVWDGTSNIAVAMLANTTGYYTTLSFSRATATDWRAIYYKNDDPITLTTGGMSPGTGEYTSYRPNIQFCFEPATCPQPTHLVVDNVTTTSARATWYPGNAETSWNYYVATEEMTDSALNTMAAQHTTTLVNALSDLTRDTDYHLYVQGKCSATDSSKWAHIAFSTLPTCSAPINAVAVSNVDGQITFDAAAGTYGTVGTYDYRYWREGTTDTVTVTGQTATYNATNVAAGDYHWQVRANCGTTDGMSRWTTGNDVRVCGEYSIPYTQGFEEVPTTYDAPGMIETICWNDLNATVDLSSTPYYVGYTYYYNEGHRSLMLTQGNVDTLYLILPSFGDAENLSVKFDAAVDYTSAPNRIKLGYFTDITDESTFVPVYTAANTSNWTSNAAYIRNLPSGARLAFSYDKYSNNSTYAYLDNIRVDTIATFSLATSVSPDANLGTVEITCQATDTTADGRFYEGSTPTLTATANAGFKFINWSNGETANPLTVTMASDTNIVANFDTISYNLNVVVSSDPGQYEMGDVTGSGVYKTGSQVTISAIDVNEHYHVLWSDGSVENPHTITMPAQNTVITAHFDIDTFQVITTQNVDSMGTVTGAGRYPLGGTATIEATPAAHHHFVQWSDGETNPQRTYTSSEDTATVSYHAIFRIDTVNITAIPNDVSRGEVTGAPGWVNYGTTVTLNVSANYPYTFKQWSDGTTDTPYVFTATQSTALTAYFTFNEFTVAVSSNNGDWGTVAGSGTGTFLYGATDTITATPNTANHYHFVNWSNGVTSNPYYHVVTNDTTIQGNFAIDQHRLNATTNNTTMGSVTGAGVYDYGTSHTITATPAANYHFVNWSNGVFDATTTVNLTSDTTIVANFAIDRHNVSATANDPALGSVTGDLGDWDYGTEVTLTAVPMNNHVTFTSWSDGTTANPYSFTVTSDTTLTATFTLDRHLLSVWSGIGGTVSSGSMYDHGDTAYVWALPADHYHFTGWSDGNMNPAFYVVMDSNYSFTATFAKDQHVVTTNVNNSAAGTVSGAGTYNYGDTATLTATANAHYEFVQWSNGATTATINVTVAGDTTLTAIFARDEHTITVNNNNPGMGTVAGGSVYTHGDMATITATANAHYHFTGWSNGVTANSFSIQVVKDSTVAANFAIDTHVVTTNVNNSAAGTVSGAGTYNWGATATLTATPAAHYVFVNWSNGATTATINVTVAGDTTLTANFARDTHVITVNNNNPTMGSVSGGNTYTHGDMATISATANDHYHFTGWSNGVTATSFSFLVEKDSTVAANFAIDTHVVTTNVNNSAAGTVSGAGTYNWGATASLVATPADHYVFVNWSNGATTATINVTVAGDTTLTANFARDTHVITVNNNNPTMGSVSGGNTYTHGDMATITATANDHYHFVNWSNGVTNDEFSILVEEDSTVAANFAIDRHVATIVSADDALGTVTGGDTYDYGTQVTANATPAANYHFLQWSNGSTANPYTFTLTSDTMLVATFTIDTLNVTVLANDDNLGTVTGTGRYTWGEEATLTATPIDHYHVAGWSNGMTGDVITITVTSDTTVTAIFEIDTFFVTGNVDGVGEIDGLGVYNYGDTVMLVASETADNYDFVGWTGDTTGLEITDLSAYVIMFVVTRDVELTAKFEYVPTSVDETEAENFIAFTEGMNVVVNGVEDHTVAVYDMTGKLVNIIKQAQDVERITVHAAGVYLVRIDNKTTLRVVVK